jgi:hypothetical protein
MTATGTSINTQSGSTSGRAGEDSQRTYIVGATTKGPHDIAVEHFGMDEFDAVHGPDLASSYTRASVELAFRTGATSVVVARDIAADAVAATVAIGAANGFNLVATAASRGTWANGYKVTTNLTGGLTVTVKDPSDNVVDTAGPFASNAAASAYFATSNFIRVDASTVNATPAAVTNAILGSTVSGSNGAALDISTYKAALARLLSKWGIGQLCGNGYTGAAFWQAMIDHAAQPQFDRKVEADWAVTGSDYAAKVTAFKAALATINTYPNSDRLSLWPAKAVCRGGIGGATRLVPYSAIQCGMTAASDETNLPGTPVANANGKAPADVVGLEWEIEVDDDRDQVKKLGGSIARIRNGVVTSYEDRVATTAAVGTINRSASDARLLMAIRRELDENGEQVTNTKLDVNNVNASRLHRDGLATGQKYFRARLLGLPGDARRGIPAQTFKEAWQLTTYPDPDNNAFVQQVDLTIARTGEVVSITIVNHNNGG